MKGNKNLGYNSAEFSFLLLESYLFIYLPDINLS